MKNQKSNMLKKTNIKRIIPIAMMVLFVAFIMGNGACGKSTKLQNAVAGFQQAGFSDGNVILIGDMTDFYGEKVYMCSDTKYEYYIDDDSFHIRVASLNSTEYEKLMLSKQVALEEREFVQKGHDLIAILFPFMDENYLEIEYQLSTEESIRTPSFTITERRDDCLVNNGSIDLSRNGTLISFGSTYNSFDDFKDTNKFNKKEICEMVFSELQETSAGGLTDDELTQENVLYLRVEKVKLGADIVWLVEVKTVPDGMDPENVYGTMLYKIDVNTGKIDMIS